MPEGMWRNVGQAPLSLVREVLRRSQASVAHEAGVGKSQFPKTRMAVSWEPAAFNDPPAPAQPTPVSRSFPPSEDRRRPWAGSRHPAPPFTLSRQMVSLRTSSFFIGSPYEEARKSACFGKAYGVKSFHVV